MDHSNGSLTVTLSKRYAFSALCWASQAILGDVQLVLTRQDTLGLDGDGDTKINLGYFVLCSLFYDDRFYPSESDPAEDGPPTSQKPSASSDKAALTSEKKGSEHAPEGGDNASSKQGSKHETDSQAESKAESGPDSTTQPPLETKAKGPKAEKRSDKRPNVYGEFKSPPRARLSNVGVRLLNTMKSSNVHSLFTCSGTQFFAALTKLCPLG